MSTVKIKFVSRKINKIRWFPKNPSLFVTGSYDDAENNITVWKFPVSSSVNGESENDLELADPTALNSVPFGGDVTDLKVLSEDFLFASSSSGSISAFNFSEEKLEHTHTWKDVHRSRKGSAPTTGIAVKGHSLASVGEDGKLCLFNISTKQKVKEIDSNDLCSLTCVCYMRHQEIIAGNSLGYLRLWDLRHPLETPSFLLMLSREQKPVTCMNIHPTQSHILATGYEDGSLCMWDMRHERKPMSLLDAHTAVVSELLFHPINPDFLFTASIDGTLWQWDSSNLKKSLPAHNISMGPEDHQTLVKGNPWLVCETNKHKLDVTEVFSEPCSCVNSLDIIDSSLLWSTDSETVCILNDITV